MLGLLTKHFKTKKLTRKNDRIQNPNLKLLNIYIPVYYYDDLIKTLPTDKCKVVHATFSVSKATHLNEWNVCSLFSRLYNSLHHTNFYKNSNLIVQDTLVSATNQWIKNHHLPLNLKHISLRNSFNKRQAYQKLNELVNFSGYDSQKVNLSIALFYEKFFVDSDYTNQLASYTYYSVGCYSQIYQYCKAHPDFVLAVHQSVLHALGSNHK